MSHTSPDDAARREERLQGPPRHDTERPGAPPSATVSTRNPLVREPQQDPQALAVRAATVLRMAIDATAPEKLDADRIRAALDAAERAAADEGAVVAHLAGVGILALFGLGGPDPDDASRALAAARAARRAVRAEAGLDLRAAVDAGAVLAGNLGAAAAYELAALGPVAKRTERLLAHAESGEILAGPGAAGDGLVRLGLVRFGDVELEVFRDDRP